MAPTSYPAITIRGRCSVTSSLMRSLRSLPSTRAELRDEWQAAIDKAVTELRAEKDLHEAIAELRGQLAAVMNLVGNGNGVKLFEAEQTVRKLKVSAGEGGT